MNYIRHLNGVFKKMARDTRLNPTHISLYIALFQYWNLHRFPEIFFIDRAEIMDRSKIGSKATYHRCLHALHAWQYLYYLPSHNPYKGSRIKMLIFDTSSEQLLNKPQTSLEQASDPNTNNNKQDINLEKRQSAQLPKNDKDVLQFFEIKQWPLVEAQKFYNHYQAVGWKIGGKAPITDWKAAAENWMLRTHELNSEKQHLAIVHSDMKQNPDNLKTKKEKNYGQPL